MQGLCCYLGLKLFLLNSFHQYLMSSNHSKIHFTDHVITTATNANVINTTLIDKNIIIVLYSLKFCSSLLVYFIHLILFHLLRVPFATPIQEVWQKVPQVLQNIHQTYLYIEHAYSYLQFYKIVYRRWCHFSNPFI